MAQVLLEITTNESSYVTERRFPESMTIAELKNRLEVITGASAGTMKLSFHDVTGALLGEGEDGKNLGDYTPSGAERLQLRVKDENVIKCDDLSGVPKYEMSAEEYEKRGDSVMAFKMRNKLGRFSDSAAAAAAAAADEEKVEHIKVGDRCEVTVKGVNPRRGTVKFVGKLPEKQGAFVGVHYDEPCGKNDGTFQGVRYFECPANHGSFVRPSDVKVGDFPEEEINFDD